MGDITAAPHEPVAGGPRMKLHHFFRSSASFRVRIALNLKEISWEAVSVDLRAVPPQQRSAEFLALNPLGLVPVLTDQSSAFTQSLAIIEYLEETFPNPALLPKQAADRARARSLALAIACDIHPLGNLRILNYLRSEYQRDEDSVNAWVRRWVGDGFSALGIQAQALGDGRHLFGASVTLADICLFPQMYNARRFGCDLTPYPTLGAVCAHLQTISAFANAAPEAFGAITR